MNGVNACTSNSLDLFQKYCNFLIKNPLAKFIPKTKLCNSRNYQEYESEYMLHYNLIKNANENNLI